MEHGDYLLVLWPDEENLRFSLCGGVAIFHPSKVRLSRHTVLFVDALAREGFSGTLYFLASQRTMITDSSKESRVSFAPSRHWFSLAALAACSAHSTATVEGAP